MAQQPQNQRAMDGQGNAPAPNRKLVPLLILVLVTVAVGVYVVVRPKNPKGAPVTAPDVPAATGGVSTEGTPAEAGRQWTAPRPPPLAVATPVAAVPPAVTAALPAPPTETVPTMAPELLREQLTQLAVMDLSQGNLTPEQLATMSQAVQGLFAQGQQAFAGAVSQMSPTDIERLTHNLSALAPDQYRPFALAAATAALTAAIQNPNKEDVGALFRVLQEHGGAEAAPQLENLAQNYKYYSTIALANLADNAGVPSLIRMVADPSSPSYGSRNAALQALAQVAWTSPEALTVLQDQAKANTIPFPTWINIASLLGGHNMQIGTTDPTQLPPELAAGNMKSWHLEMTKEDFYSLPDQSQLTPEGIQKRQQIIADLMQVTTDPTVKQLLEQANNSLVARGASPSSPGN